MDWTDWLVQKVISLAVGQGGWGEYIVLAILVFQAVPSEAKGLLDQFKRVAKVLKSGTIALLIALKDAVKDGNITADEKARLKEQATELVSNAIGLVVNVVTVAVPMWFTVRKFLNKRAGKG